MINKVGKRGLINQETNRKLKSLYFTKGITECEIGLPGCAHNYYLGFAHRHKRREYYSNPDSLASFNQTVLACVYCHNKIEYNSELTEKVFLELRGKDELPS